MGGGSKTATSNQNQQAVTTPSTPDYALDPVKNYFSGISNYQAADPYSFVTPANSLQTAAYGNASGLFGSSNLYGQAAAGANGVMNAAPTTAQAGVTNANAANAGQAQGVNLGGYTPGTLGGAAQAQGQGYNTATLGTAAQAGPVGLDPKASQASSQSLLTNLQAYQNPFTDQVVNTSLADFDSNSAQTRAAQQAAAARGGAFGGSRYGIQQAATEGELARGRGSLDANLRSNAFNTAANLSGQDADRRQNASLFNAGAQNQRSETLAGLNASNNQFNAGQTNQYGLAQFGAQNDANQFAANASNTANLTNANANNQYGLAQFGANNDAARYASDASNQGSLFNAGAANDFSLANAGYQQQANLTNAGAQNQAAQFNAGQTNQMQDSQLSRQLQASGLLGDLAGSYGQNYRADLGTQADLGNQLYQMQSAANNAPLTQLQNLGNLLNPGYLQAVSGQTVTGQNSGVDQSKQSGGLLNGLLGVASIAAPFIPSDRRLKDNIRRIGKTDSGLPIYSYRYKGDDRPQIGVMAQDVEVMQPEALGPIWNGFKTVNYAEVR